MNNNFAQFKCDMCTKTKHVKQYVVHIHSAHIACVFTKCVYLYIVKRVYIKCLYKVFISKSVISV